MRLTYNTCIEKASNMDLDCKKLNRGFFNKEFVNKDATEASPKLKESILRTHCTTREVAAHEALCAFNNEIKGSSTRFKKEVKALNKLKRKVYLLKDGGKDFSKEQFDVDNFEYIPSFSKRRAKDKRQVAAIPKESIISNGKLLQLFPTTRFKNEVNCKCKCSCKRVKLCKKLKCRNDCKCLSPCNNSKEECKASNKELILCKCHKMGSIRATKNIPKITKDCKLILESDSWYLSIPYEVEPKQIEKIDSVVAIDPGVRTFMSCGDMNGNITEYADGWMKDMNKDFNRKDNLHYQLQMLLKEAKDNDDNDKKLVFKLRMAALKAKKQLLLATNKITNKIKDLHHKIASSLVNRYDYIILPELKTKDILKKYCHEYNRRVMCISHCSFYETLKHKALKLGKIILKGDEAYTSKTCLNCLKHNDIKESKEHLCSCGYKGDRDVTSSFNIMLKNIKAATASQHDPSEFIVTLL